jgi:hypothetical protein
MSAADCPVCRQAAAAAECGHCGRRLLGGYVIGAPPPQAQRALDGLIARERRSYALRVAVRAAGWRGAGALAALAALAGGDTPPSDDEIQDAQADCDQETMPRPAAAGVGFTLTRLVAGDCDAIEFVELSPDGIAVRELAADEFGVPRPGPGDQVRWAVPGLPDDDDLRSYLLAGDPGTPAAASGQAPTAQTARVARAAEREVARLVRAGGGRRLDRVLVRRTQRWPSLEAAAARARPVLRPVAEVVARGSEPLAAIIEEILRQAPLRYDYCLVLAAVDPATGRVRPAPRTLFPAGTARQQRVPPTADVPVTAPAAAADRLILPVVARRGDDPAGWPEVGGGTMDGTVPGVTRLRIRLEAPGRVSLTGTPGPVSADRGPGWPGALAALPDRLSGAALADVVLLAELGGQRDTVASRMHLVGGVAGGLDLAGVKVAVLGYREHHDRYTKDAAEPADRLVVGCGLSDAADLRPVLAQREVWQAVEIRDRYAAPLEDALEVVAGPDWAWRPGVRHLLVVFASRPPHPSGIDDRGEVKASPCRYTVPWRDMLGQLRREWNVQCLVVLPERQQGVPLGDYAERAWADFGAELRYADRAPAGELMRAIGIGPANDAARLPLAVSADGRGPGEGR